MTPDLLEQLAEMEVPPTPAHFDDQLHDKVNRWLVATQLIDLAFSGLPWALGHFGRAFVGLIIFTVTGRYDSKSKNQRR